MRKRTRRVLTAAAIAMLPLTALSAPAADAKLPAGTCGASDGCGCGGIYVLKYKFILAHC